MTLPNGVDQFVDDDDAYLQWVAAHPKGFVVNSHKVPKPSYLRLHRATCAHIRTDGHSNWTTTGYIKTCSHDASALASWSKDQVGGNLDPCSFCKPV